MVRIKLSNPTRLSLQQRKKVSLDPVNSFFGQTIFGSEVLSANEASCSIAEDSRVLWDSCVSTESSNTPPCALIRNITLKPAATLVEDSANLPEGFLHMKISALNACFKLKKTPFCQLKLFHSTIVQDEKFRETFGFKLAEFPLVTGLTVDDEFWPLWRCLEIYICKDSELPGHGILAQLAGGFQAKKDSCWSVDLHSIPVSLPFSILVALKSYKFRLVFDIINQPGSSTEFMISVWLRSSAVATLTHPCDPISIQNTETSSSFRSVIVYFYSLQMIAPVEEPSIRKEYDDIARFYKQMKDIKNCLNYLPQVDVQNCDLVPEIRPYQRNAIRWMLFRERETHIVADHPMYRRLALVDGSEVAYNVQSGALVDSMPQITTGCKGGILADEMGLGKTVEILAVVLLNPKPSQAECEGINTDDAVVTESSLTVPEWSTLGWAQPQTRCSGTQDQFTSCKLALDELVAEVASKLDSESFFAKFSHKRRSGRGKKRKLSLELDWTLDSESASTPKKQRSSPRRQSIEAADDNPNDSYIKALEKLECLCGNEDGCLSSRDKQVFVCCKLCGSYQHSQCVNWLEAVHCPAMDYLCPHCRCEADPIISGATLIVSPATICHQWYQEIRKHLRKQSLKIFVYNGVSKLGFAQPSTLASQDIVITTYETLKTELNYLDLTSKQRFRHRKRFMAPPTPLPAVHWWRICLDEAQLAESSTSRVAEICGRLSAEHRWCVSGTPLQRSVKDLHGLVTFLGMEPYFVKQWWDRLVWWPYLKGDSVPMIDVLGEVFWRTAKRDVLDQLGLPKMHQHVTWIDFSPIEEHFYRRLHEDIRQNIQQALLKYTDRSVKLKSLDRQSLDALMRPLLRLRQACVHPQVARSYLLGGVRLGRQPAAGDQHGRCGSVDLSMEDVLERMIARTLKECEDNHRTRVFALSGIAGLALLEFKVTEAAEAYREALALSHNVSSEVRTDALQMIHLLTNLAEVLEQNPGVIPPTLQDSELLNEVRKIKQSHFEDSAAKLLDKANKAQQAAEQVFQLSKQLREHEAWWIEVSNFARLEGLEEDLVDRVMTSMEVVVMDDPGRTHREKSWRNRFHNLDGLQYLISKHWTELMDSRQELELGLFELAGFGLDDVRLNRDALECHLRPLNNKPLGKCKICEVQQLFVKYENQLYILTDKIVKDRSKRLRDGMQSNQTWSCQDDPRTVVEGCNQEQVNLYGALQQVFWSDSCLERALRSLLQFAKTNEPFKITRGLECVDAGILQLKVFDSLKKEFKSLRDHWMKIRDHVALNDEFTMATERLKLRPPQADALPDETSGITESSKAATSTRSCRKKAPKRPDQDRVDLIDPWEVGDKREEFKNQLFAAQNIIAQKLRHLQYLKNLRNLASSREFGNEEECPICRGILGHAWCVFSCGHCLCIDCFDIVRKRSNVADNLVGNATAQMIQLNRKMFCHVCRQETLVRDISYVKTDRANQSFTDDSSSAESGSQHQALPQLIGSYSSKIMAILRKLRRILRKEPGVKILVFSAWNEVLNILSNALNANEIAHFSLVNASQSKHSVQRQLSTFKGSTVTHVLLLPLAVGANGLNIVEASHVVLVEPCMNLSQEQQAIGRIDRMGQKRETTVHRFIVKGSIEEKMHHLNDTTLASRLEKGVDSHLGSDIQYSISDLETLFG